MNSQDMQQQNNPQKQGIMWRIVIAELAILGLFFIAFLMSHKKTEEVLITVNQPVIVTMSLSEQLTLTKTPEQLVDEYMETMTLEEKVGQLFYVTVGNLATPEYSGTNVYLNMNDDISGNIHTYYPGGVILMGENIESDEQVTELIQNLQNESEIPLYVGVDEEGGIVSRLGGCAGITMENVGTMQAVGETQDAGNAYHIGETLGSGLRQYGFNMDFAPDADVLTNPANTEIGSRSFGADANLVADMVENEVLGMQEQGVSAVAKHFPGHGGVIGNSHKNLQYIDTPLESLRQTELVPFLAAMNADTDAILISHLVLTAYEEDIPSTLSSQVVTGLLREELGYDGIIITDSFQMGSVTENYDQSEAATLAIQAGCDMVLMPMEYEACYTAVIDGVKNGSITEERINASCRRILLTKIKRGILVITQ